MQIQTVDYRSENAPRSLAQSLRETGFAVLTNHPITAARIEAIYASWGAFFASEEKHNYLRDPVRQDGFFPFKSEHAKDAKEKDLKEFFHVYPWGQLPDELAQETRQFYGDLVGLGIELLGWLDSQLPEDIAQKLSQPLQDMMAQSAQSLLGFCITRLSLPMRHLLRFAQPPMKISTLLPCWWPAPSPACRQKIRMVTGMMFRAILV